MNLLLVEHYPITRLGISQKVLEKWPDAFVAEASDVASALKFLDKRDFDVILLDLNLPDVVGVEGLVEIRRHAASTPLLILSSHTERTYAVRSFQSGAQGYLDKDRSPQELVVALEALVGGRRYFTASLAGELAELLQDPNAQALRRRHEELSPQEHRVMIQLVLGRSNVEIAYQMRISTKTISTYRSRILAKLGLRSNVDLAKYCVSHGLVPAHMA